MLFYYLKSYKYFNKVIYYIILLLFLFNNLLSQDIKIDENSKKINISSKIIYKEIVKNHQTTFDYLVKIPKESFKEFQEDYFRIEYSQNDLLLYFSITDLIDKKIYLEISDPLIDLIEVYIKNNNKYINYKSGRMISIIDRNMKDRKHIFEISSFDKNQKIDIFIKLSFEDTSIFSARILTEDTLWQENRDYNLILGLYYGLIIIVLIVYMIVYIGSNDLMYLQYILFVLSIFFFQSGLDGTYIYFLVENPEIHKKLFLLSIYFVHWVTFYTIIKIVLSEDKFKKERNFCFYLILASSLFIIPVFKLDYQASLKILNSMELIILIVIISFCITKFKKIPKSIKIQGFVILPTFLGISLFHFKNLGLLPINGFTLNVFEIFNSVQMIVLAILITLRIREPQIEIQKQKEDLESLSKQKNYEYKKLLETEEREKIILDELKLASDIQRSLIPEKEKIYPFIKVKYHYEYLMQVGGDFFDIININDNSVAVFIADASGHGISAALLATMYKMSFTNAISKSSSPAEIFREINIQTRKVLDTHDYLTAFLITISPIGEITYSSAAHRPALILRKNKNVGEILFTKGLFLGMNTNFHAPYEEKKDKLEKGDRLLLYTDGVLEESIKNSWNAETLLFSFTNSSNIGFDSALDYVIQDWKNKLGTNKIQDDATILMIEYHGI